MSLAKGLGSTFPHVPLSEFSFIHKKTPPIGGAKYLTDRSKINLITTNFKLTKESIMAILFTKEEAMKDLPFIEDKAL
ncbi:hypothetical protein ACXHPV_13230, partial [Vibrio cincinnatiensis]